MPSTLSPDVLARHADARIPRYTSYPAAPNFSDDIGEAHYRSWLSSLPPVRASLYLHMPFCRAMCWYCGCHTTVAAREAPVIRYLAAMSTEIGMVASQAAGPLSISHIHLGGGTPTLMPAPAMHSLMRQIADLFAIESDAEIAIEIDPRTLSDGMATTLGACGFNRASLGVQTFDPRVQRAINRVQSFEQTAAAVHALRANGMHRINFDLIYGLPHQSLESCRATVDRAVELRPDRLAVFGYAHVPDFKPHQRRIDAAALPGSSARFAHSRAIAEALTGAGYVEIGLDHFALPDDPLAVAAAGGRLHRNFQGYTTDEADVLIGLGASAIGRMPQGFVQNVVRIPEYERLVGEGRLPLARGYRFTGDDRLRGAVIERLMCDHRVDLASVCRDFAANPSQILEASRVGPLIADGLIELDGTTLAMRPHARPLVRSVAAAFDAHLPADPVRHSRAV